MREHGLAGNRQSESRSAGFGGHVRFPNASYLIARDATTGVGYCDLHVVMQSAVSIGRSVITACYGSYSDPDPGIRFRFCSAGIDRVENHVRERSCQGVVMSVNHRSAIVDVDLQRDVRRHRCPSCVPHELSDVDRGLWTLGQSSKLREAPCHGLQSTRLDVEYLHRFHERRRHGRQLASQTFDGEAYRGQGILQFVRDLACSLTQRCGALGFDRTSAA